MATQMEKSAVDVGLGMLLGMPMSGVVEAEMRAGLRNDACQTSRRQARIRWILSLSRAHRARSEAVAMQA